MRNREGESGRETRDVVCLEWKKKRNEKERKIVAGKAVSRKRDELRKVGVFRGNGREGDSDTLLQREGERCTEGVETERSRWRKRKIRRVAGIGTRRIARILNESGMDDARRGGTIREGERCAGVKPGGCNW